MSTPRLVSRAMVAWIASTLLITAPAFATPLDFLPVGDPLEDELRFLEIAGSQPGLPHFGMRPLQFLELPDFAVPPPEPALALTFRRLHRSVARDLVTIPSP